MENDKKLRYCCMPACANQKFELVHKFPRNRQKLMEWIVALDNPEISSLPPSGVLKKLICSRHFRPEDYKHAQSRSLNITAVPSLFLGTEVEPAVEPESSSKPSFVVECEDLIKTDEDSEEVQEPQVTLALPEKPAPLPKKRRFARGERRLASRRAEPETSSDSPITEPVSSRTSAEMADNLLALSHERLPKDLKVNFYWLRDHCRCGICYEEETSQRKTNFTDFPLTIRPKSHAFTDKGLAVTWEDGHESEYSFDFLTEFTFENRQKFYQRPREILWDRKTLEVSDYARVELNDLLCSETAVKKVLDSLVKYGLAFIEKVPPNELSTELAITRIFPTMKTFFGASMWTFTNIMDHNDLAYTTNFLPAHNDNSYFNDASGLQVLHCILHLGDGGENLAVDGFKAVEALRLKHPDAYDRLVNKWQVPAEYIEEGRNHRYTAPVIKLDPITKRVEQLRFNMNDRCVFDTVPQEEMQQFYTDMNLLAAEIQDKANEWWFKLNPGTVWIFDNWRVMHGRDRFAGKRIMTGCYVLRTEFMSAARVAGSLD